MSVDLIENIHFYYNDKGLMVLTKAYHEMKGYCCGNGCLHCPFEYENVPEPRRSRILENNSNTEDN